MPISQRPLISMFTRTWSRRKNASPRCSSLLENRENFSTKTSMSSEAMHHSHHRMWQRWWWKKMNWRIPCPHGTLTQRPHPICNSWTKRLWENRNQKIMTLWRRWTKTEKEVNFAIYLLFLYRQVYNGVSFSDLICILPYHIRVLLVYFCNTKICVFS